MGDRLEADRNGSGVDAGSIVAIVFGILLFLCCFCIVVFFIFCRKSDSKENRVDFDKADVDSDGELIRFSSAGNVFRKLATAKKTEDPRKTSIMTSTMPELEAHEPPKPPEGEPPSREHTTMNVDAVRRAEEGRRKQSVKVTTLGARTSLGRFSLSRFSRIAWRKSSAASSAPPPPASGVVEP